MNMGGPQQGPVEKIIFKSGPSENTNNSQKKTDLRKRIEKSKFDTFIPVIFEIMFDLNSYLVYIRHHFCSFLVPFATYFCAGSCLLPLVFNYIFEFAKIFMTVCGHHVP